MRPTNAAARLSGFVIVALPGVWQAWALRFVQDDAYISWRYAENLARGLGLVWNEGEYVEGYTNFLWTVILAIPHRVGLDVEMFATVARTCAVHGHAGDLLCTGRDADAIVAGGGRRHPDAGAVPVVRGLRHRWARNPIADLPGHRKRSR